MFSLTLGIQDITASEPPRKHKKTPRGGRGGGRREAGWFSPTMPSWSQMQISASEPGAFSDQSLQFLLLAWFSFPCSVTYFFSPGDPGHCRGQEVFWGRTQHFGLQAWPRVNHPQALVLGSPLHPHFSFPKSTK